MLLYNKAFDPCHTLLRYVSIIIAINKDVIEHDRLRIFDFITANPSHIYEMSLGQNLRSKKNPFKSYASSYNQYDPFILFESMRPIQQAAISSLVELSVLSCVENTTRYSINLSAIPVELNSIAKDKNNSIPRDAINFIKEQLIEFDLFGGRGLKAASKLMEYRYDIPEANYNSK